jgi:hypothetical protein
MNTQFLLYNNPDQLDFRKMPFPKNWGMNALCDKTDKIHGYLRVRAYDESKNHKLIHDDGGDNQVMYWLKHSFAMLDSGLFYSTAGEHKGLDDNSGTEKDETNLPYGWHYLNIGGYVYSTHVWDNTTKTMAIENSIGNVNLFPFFPTKMRFGTAAPTNISTPINPDDIYLNDTQSRGAGNGGNLNFILISRTTHIGWSTTGYNLTTPSGYYADYGGSFKNITIYQVTMPASVSGYCYDGKTLNEAGLYCDAALTDTANGGVYDQLNGMILCKRYFNGIQKTNTISINFQWSIVK